MDIRNICPGVRFIYNGQLHTGNAFRQLCDAGLRFPQKVGRKCHILPHFRCPYPADLFDRSLIKHIVLPVVGNFNGHALIRFHLIAFLIRGLNLCPKGNQCCHTFCVVERDFHIGQVLPVLHFLKGGFRKIRKIIQHLPDTGISKAQIPSVCFNELILNGIQGHRIVRATVSHIIVVIDYCYFSYKEPFLFFHTFVMLGYEILKKSSQVPLVVIGRLLAVI